MRVGRKEQEILNYLSTFPCGVWKEDLINNFSFAKRYNMILNKRLQNMEKKGLIIIKTEINPETGRQKKRVYLRQ